MDVILKTLPFFLIFLISEFGIAAFSPQDTQSGELVIQGLENVAHLKGKVSNTDFLTELALDQQLSVSDLRTLR